MTQPFLVIESVESKIGQVLEVDQYDEAVEVATDLACEQTTIPRCLIRSELASDLSWCDETGNIWIQIVQAERVKR